MNRVDTRCAQDVVFVAIITIIIRLLLLIQVGVVGIGGYYRGRSDSSIICVGVIYVRSVGVIYVRSVSVIVVCIVVNISVVATRCHITTIIVTDYIINCCWVIILSA